MRNLAWYADIRNHQGGEVKNKKNKKNEREETLSPSPTAAAGRCFWRMVNDRWGIMNSVSELEDGQRNKSQVSVQKTVRSLKAQCGILIASCHR